MGNDRDPPACSHIQGDVTAERQPFVVGVVLKSCGLGRGRQACAGTSVSSSAFPRFRERELHPLLVFVSSSSAPVQALGNLARVLLELHRLDEICVPLEISLSTYFTTVHFLNIDLPSW